MWQGSQTQIDLEPPLSCHRRATSTFKYFLQQSAIIVKINFFFTVFPLLTYFHHSSTKQHSWTFSYTFNRQCKSFYLNYIYYFIFNNFMKPHTDLTNPILEYICTLLYFSPDTWQRFCSHSGHYFLEVLLAVLHIWPLTGDAATIRKRSKLACHLSRPVPHNKHPFR